MRGGERKLKRNGVWRNKTARIGKNIADAIRQMNDTERTGGSVSGPDDDDHSSLEDKHITHIIYIKFIESIKAIKKHNAGMAEQKVD